MYEASSIPEREREIERLRAELSFASKLAAANTARVAELEAELAATERTLNAWIVRAKELEHSHDHPSRD